MIRLKLLPTKPKHKPSLQEPPTLELKPLPEHLEYALLSENETLPVIIAKSLTGVENEKLMEVLGCYKLAFRWIITVIQWISLAIVTHHIYTYGAKKLVRQP